MGKILNFISGLVLIVGLFLTPVSVFAQSKNTNTFSFFDSLVEGVTNIFSLSVESQVRQAIELKEERRSQLESLPQGSRQRGLFQNRLEVAEQKLAGIIEKSKNPAEKAKILKQIEAIEAELQKKKQQEADQQAVEKNIFNLVANYDLTNQRVNLTWQNPILTEPFEIKVVRRDDAIPADLANDPVVYSGVGQSFVDTNISSNTTYFYSVFVVIDNETSSGVVASVLVPQIEEEIFEDGEVNSPGPLNEEELIDVAVTSESTENFTEAETVNLNDPFSGLLEAESVDPAILAITSANFKLIQTGETEQILTENGLLIKDDKDLIMRFDPVGNMASLKTIGVSVKNSSDEQVFSFLLKPQTGDSYYLARIVSLGEVGTYPITIYLINNNDEVMKKISGELLVSVGVGFNSNMSAVFFRVFSVTLGTILGLAY